MLGRCLVRSSDTEQGKAMIEEAIRIRKAAVQTPDDHEELGENVCHVMLGATYNDLAGESKNTYCLVQLAVRGALVKKDSENVVRLTILARNQ